MAYDEETAFILPRSQVGVFGPVLFIAWHGAPPLGLDVALLDEIASCEAGLLLTIGEFKVALKIADGPEGTLRLVEGLAPWVRTAPISNADIYNDAKRRLTARDDSDYRLIVGDDMVLVSGDTVTVGATSYKIEDVQERAKRGETLRVSSGASVQAAFLMLIVEAEHRPGGREGLDILARRVADFESRG